MKNRIINILKSSPDFIYGQEICSRLGVSRTAVWKHINILKEEGYVIESVSRKGYRLLQSPDLITREEIRKYLPDGLPGGEIYCYDSVDSTNEEAKRAVGYAPDRSVFVANQQTAGKGRRGRTWISPKGEDLFFSLLLRPDIPPESASMLTLVAAMAAAEVAERYSRESCQIKWPNDIVLHNRKICGILTEMGAEMGEISYVIIGVGFNLNRTEFEEDIASMATSIRKETGERITRAAFLADFLAEFMKRFEIFLREGNLRPFVKEYDSHLINVGKEVKIISRQGTRIRTALGINEKGELRIQDELGREETVFTGEVSVRGLYGYV